MKIHVFMISIFCVSAAVSAKEIAYKTINIQKGHAILFAAPPAGCREIMSQAKSCIELSQKWLEQRKKGNRRIDSGDLVFFQYEKNKLKSPFARLLNASTKEIISEVFYDPFEFLGYLANQSIQLTCADDSGWVEPRWPFAGFEGTADEIAVTYLKKIGSRFAYVESFDSIVTDVYYCSKKIPEGTQDKIVDKLGKVFANGRLEDTPVFTDFTKYREQLCGETN